MAETIFGFHSHLLWPSSRLRATGCEAWWVPEADSSCICMNCTALWKWSGCIVKLGDGGPNVSFSSHWTHLLLLSATCLCMMFNVVPKIYNFKEAKYEVSKLAPCSWSQKNLANAFKTGPSSPTAVSKIGYLTKKTQNSKYVFKNFIDSQNF